MRVYLAGPMRGIPYLNFPAFHAAAAKLRADGYTVFNPAEHDEAQHGKAFSESNPTGSLDKSWQDFEFDLRQTMIWNLDWICGYAEAIAMLPGWEKSDGARCEYYLAQCLGLEVVLL